MFPCEALLQNPLNVYVHYSFAVVYLTTNSFGSHENIHYRGLSLSSYNLLLLKRCKTFLLIIVFLLAETLGEDCEKI